MPRVVAALHQRARQCREHASFVGEFSSANSAIQDAIHHLDAAAVACEAAATDAMEANRRARDWALEMVGGGGGSSGGGSSTARPARSTKSGASPGNNSGAYAAGRGNPVAQRVIRDRLPARPDPLAKTHGIWLGRSGEERDLVSGYDEHSDRADRLRERLGIPPVTIVSHVEVKFAMFMRDRSLRNETIYINNVPCKGLQSCSRYLESFLPRGSSLTVHWPDSEPRTFEGKGPE